MYDTINSLNCNYLFCNNSAMTKTDLRDYSKTMLQEEIDDPLQLLKTLSSYLNEKGAVAGTDEAINIVGYMRHCKKLVGRCIYLNILRVTKNEEVLRKFMSGGGWKILNKWISDAKETDNEPVIHEILKLLKRLPVALQDLRVNNTAKIVKQLAKSQNSKIQAIATVIVQSWLAVITVNSAPSEAELLKKKKVKEKEKKKVKAESNAKPQTKRESKIPPPVMKAPSFAKFRKTGLETETAMPEKKPKVRQGQPIRKRNSTESAGPVPDKKMKAETKTTKKIMISDSEGFMDALNSASNPAPLTLKKVKRRPTKPVTISNTANSNKTQQSEEVVSGDANDFSAAELLSRLSPQRENTSPVPAEPPKPKLNKYGKPMKTVRFKSDEYIADVRYFEVDENERVNVSTQNFKDAQHREMLIERELMKGGKIESSGNGDWQRPTVIDGLDLLTVPGCNSVEKDIQTEREKTVLMSIFLSKEMVPESPAEPDPEPYEIMQPKIIPFEDESAVAELMETDQEVGSSADDVILKNLKAGMQAEQGADVFTANLKRILETASAMKPSAKEDNTTPVAASSPPAMAQPAHQPMVWEGAPPMVDPNMMVMNGQMPFFPGQPMMVPDPNFYQPNWNPSMGPPRPMYDQNWGPRPNWRGSRNGPPSRGRNGFRGRNDNYHGRRNDARR